MHPMYQILMKIIEFANDNHVEVVIETPTYFGDSISLKIRRGDHVWCHIFPFEELNGVRDPDMIDTYIAQKVMDFNANCGEATF